MNTDCSGYFSPDTVESEGLTIRIGVCDNYLGMKDLDRESRLIGLDVNAIILYHLKRQCPENQL